ncbi:SLBB domain-containing protein [Gammaproteobacteria bacterium]|nr:SLBB domain-containing protein [Gammaproteobacteria bacterium]
MKINILSSQFFLTGVLSTLMFQPLLAQQDDDMAMLLEKLTGEKKGETQLDRPDMDSGYKSFVQNELQSIFAEIDALSEQDKMDITFAEVNEKRIDLATSLCSRDIRACFLVDEYQSYKSHEDFPKTFKELELFGQDIFSGYSNDFNFYDSLPLGENYSIKIGDQLKITLFGGFAFDEVIKVDMTGSIIIPDIGEFQVAGLSYEAASNKIKQDISKKYVGTEAFISLEQIRSKQVFALGNVKTPGTYALNAFGSALNALISSGGVKDNSSLRSIQIVRNNNTIKTIDLYKLLIDGDAAASDFELNDGDAVLIGGLQASASIIGEVLRPAIYEIAPNDSLQQIIKFALGTSPFADLTNISVERILPSGEKIILNPDNISAFIMQNGDRVVVNSASGQTISSVSLIGAVRNAGKYSIKDKKTLGDIIKVDQDLMDDTYTGFGIIKRLNFLTKSFRILNFNLTTQAELDQLNIYSGDQIFIFSRDDIKYSRSQEVYSYLAENISALKPDSSNAIDQFEQASNLLNNANGLIKTPVNNECLNALDVLTQNPISNLVSAKLKIFPSGSRQECTPIFQEHADLLPLIIINSIPVAGNVRFPGLYPTSQDLNALELFNLAGGFLLSKLNDNPSFDIGIRSRGFGSFDFNQLSTLTNITMLSLKLDQSSVPGGYVKLVGEFKNPGIYPILRGIKISEIYARAGGLSAQAYPLGGILTRNSIQLIESEALARAKSELSEILASAVASGYLKQNSTDLVGLVSLMTSMSNSKSIGRLVTELNPTKIAVNPSLDITLKDGDIVYMPPLQNTITIVGQVLNPVTVPHKVGNSFDDYLKLAGGLKKGADKGKIYAVLPNGVSTRRKNRINLPVIPFMPFDRSDILPGSTIIVPRQARPLDSLALVETVTPILANLAVTAASIAAISDNN